MSGPFGHFNLFIETRVPLPDAAYLPILQPGEERQFGTCCAIVNVGQLD